jgi:1,2-phenylacetyl-CoA epoxidase PaaB subunit
VFTPEETASYLERKKRRESHSRSPDRSHSDRSKSPHSVFTPEETASYLERKKRRENQGKKQGGGGKILVFY